MILKSSAVISIIVPVYNTENYLSRCLQSLVQQTVNSIEILVVNDGSTDGSQDIIDEFQSEYPDKIFPFKKENGGLSDARNYGLDRASGKYIGFVDSDDYVNHAMFEEMVSLAEKHQAQITICNIQKVDENGVVLQKLTQLPNFPERVELSKNLSLFSDISYFACNKIFRKELFNQKRFKKGIHYEDIQLIPQLVLECETVAQTQIFHYQYFERSESISKSHTLKGLDILHAVEDVEKVFFTSKFKQEKEAIDNFRILEGVYTFLAYLAFVNDKESYSIMATKLKVFRKERGLSLIKVLKYRRFGQNYLLSLPFQKQVYYVLLFLGQEKLINALQKVKK